MDIAPGLTISHIRFVERIGEGGMGVVWKAVDTRLDREVAVKVLPDLFARDEERLARFDREAKVLASLNHPGIAAIHGLEEIDGHRLLIMELVPGTNLMDCLEAGPLPVEDALEMARQMADALEAAHESGVIHRDLKPANIQVTPEGKIKILDFGLAKALETEASATTGSMSPTLTTPATRAGVVLGTAAYMSPEQAKGKRVDRRADIWSFGCVLYEMLSGRRPFGGEGISETLAAVIMAPADLDALPAAAPAAVKRLIRRCLEKDPRKRLRDVGEARVLVEEILSGGVTEEQETAGMAAAKAPRSLARRLGPLAGILVVAAVAAAVTWWVKPGASPAPVRKFEIHDDDMDRLSSSSTLAISPDGMKVAWLGTDCVWVRDLDRVEPRRIETAQDPRMLAWSPDSASLAFAAEGRLWKVPEEGGQPAHIGDIKGDVVGGAGASWGSGDRIVFSLGSGGIFEVSARGGDPRSILEPDPDTESDLHEPSLLPEGKGILFVSHTKGAGPDTIVLLAGDERKVLLHLEGQSLSRPIYAPDGYILYHRTPGSPGIWALPFSLSRLEPTGEPFLVVADGSQPSASDDGTLAYATGSVAQRSRMIWVDREGREVGKLGEPGDFSAVRLALSPDGRRVAVAKTDGETEDIWIYDADRGTSTRLTFGEERKRWPAWTHTGERLAYFRGDTTKSFELLVAPADGTSAPEAVGKGIMPSFAPGDKEVVGVGFDEKTRMTIFRLPLEGDRKEALFTKSATDSFAPEVSPDGHYLAYVSNETGRDEVYIKRYPDASGKWQVSANGGSWPHWSAKGDELYFAHGDDVMAVDVATGGALTLGSPRKLFARKPLGSILYRNWPPDFAVTPDGQRFLIFEDASSGGRKASIEIVENWAAEFRHDE